MSQQAQDIRDIRTMTKAGSLVGSMTCCAPAAPDLFAPQVVATWPEDVAVANGAPKRVPSYGGLFQRAA